jgi:hypothetical protein
MYDDCEFRKHTRNSYISLQNKSSHIFYLVHSNVLGFCSTTEIDEHRFCITFIDCYIHIIWLYLMKNKSDALACFKNFHKAAQT